MSPDERGRGVNFPKSFGKYKLIDRIAVGGMADIFKAKTTGIGGFEKVLVIKRLHDRLSEDDEFIEMMVDEAKIAVRLNHPNIAKIFDLGCIRDKYFIAMEYIKGPDVSDMMGWEETSRGDVPVPAILHLGAEVCAGLHFAHTREDSEGRPMNIVHRDISPPNIMISTEGEVKIVDFGIAKARKRVQETRHGIIKGKFHYMAPEQAHGRRVDARTDVFSVGMVLYEMLSGRNPYDGVADSEMLKAVRRAQFPSIREFRPRLDPELDRLVMRALERNPNGRWNTAAEFEKALRDYRDRKTESFDRRRMAELAGEVWKDVSENGQQRVERSSLMTGHEYEASDESLIFEVPSAQQQTGPGADGSENPFDEDAPTEVWEGGDSSGGRTVTAGGPQVGSGQNGGGPAGAASAGDIQGARGGPSGADRGGTAGAGGPGGSQRAGAAGPAGNGRSGSERRASPSDEPTPQPDFGDAPPAPGANSDAFVTGSPNRKTATPTSPESGAPKSSRQDTDQQDDGGGSVGSVLGGMSKRLEDAGISRRAQIYAGLAAMIALSAGIGVGIVVLTTGGGSQTEDGSAITAESDEPTEDEKAGADGTSVSIQSIPKGAQVRVDGRRVGTTPHTLSSLEPGSTHEVEISRDGYETVTKTIRASGDSEPVVVELSQTDAVLRVTTYPSDARIEVDGDEVGYSPVTVPELRRDGTYDVVAELDEGQTKRRTVTWSEDDESFKKIRLRFEDKPKADREDGSDRRRYGRRGRSGSRHTGRSRSAGTSSNRGSRRPNSGSRQQNDEQADQSGSSSSSSSGSSSGDSFLYGNQGSSSGGSGAGGTGSSADEQGDSKTAKQGSGGNEQAKKGDDTNLDIWSMSGQKGGGGSGGDGSGKGYLTVKVTDGSGKVYIDGELVNKSPLSRHPVAPGSHQVKVYYPVLKRFSEERNIVVKEGESESVSFRP